MESVRVKVEAVLRLPDGREFAHCYDVEEQYAKNQESWWTDGNASCDCNRSLFLNRDHGLNLGVLEDEGYYDVPCMPCGDTIALVSVTVGGKRVI